MGLTPLEGLVMGTRSGDIDPSVVSYLTRRANMSVDDDRIHAQPPVGGVGAGGGARFPPAARHDRIRRRRSKLAYDVFIHRLRKYIGAYLAVLGHTDVITFTAGIGENARGGARDAVAGMEGLGVCLDEDRNLSPDNGARRISAG